MFEFQSDYQFWWNLGLLLAFLFAVGVGWYIGFKNGKRPDKQTPLSVVESYYKGLNYLVGGQPEDAVDTFIDALEVNTETFEIHLALGNFLRGRGEVDRAIRIHQNLLARSGMGKSLRDTAHLELARDYLSAGVYDRSERLLEELVIESKELKDLSLKFLLDIYEAEQDWSKALDTADKLRSRSMFFKDRRPEQRYLLSKMAHYHCELVESCEHSLSSEHIQSHLEQALELDDRCVRASLLMAEQALVKTDPEQAIKYVRRVFQQDKEFIPEALGLLSRAYMYLNDSSAHKKDLKHCLSLTPSVSVVLALCELMEKDPGSQALAGEELKNFLQRFPNQKGLLKLIDYELSATHNANKENLFLLQEVLTKIVSERPVYQCQHCGFSGKKLHWKCPSCKQWGMVKMIQGIKGD
ncbi:MAG: lipopolysaccharide assembly protein LapB [Pseudomonadota bacterium]